MEIIWENQNPPNCRTARYLIIDPYLSGFASEYHVYTVALGLAIQDRRVLLLTDDSHHWRYQHSFCEEQQKTTMDCFLLPWSKCTLEDAYYVQENALHDHVESSLYSSSMNKNNNNEEWTLKEQERLTNLVLQEGLHRNWQRISNRLQTQKTPLQCYHHWKEVLYPTMMIQEHDHNNHSTTVSYSISYC